MNQHLAEAAVTDLAARLGPGAVVTAGAAYEQTCRIWNGAVTSRPAVVVRARTQDDVQAAVRATRCHGLPLSVRAGGHDWAGRSLRDGGLVIDLSGMTQVTVNPEEGTATVSGGATAADVIAAAAPHGLAAVTGTVGSRRDDGPDPRRRVRAPQRPVRPGRRQPARRRPRARRRAGGQRGR